MLLQSTLPWCRGSVKLDGHFWAYAIVLRAAGKFPGKRVCKALCEGVPCCRAHTPLESATILARPVWAAAALVWSATRLQGSPGTDWRAARSPAAV